MELENYTIYKEQLKQINLALESIDEGPEKNELLSLKENIEELLALTKNEDSEPPDRLDEEYALFQAELAEDTSTDSSSKSNDELKKLEGTRCRAPYRNSSGEIAYHNALISSIITEDNETKALVLFTNPTQREMLPCTYYLDGKCRRMKNCKYSHGELVNLSNLQEYIEPNFELLAIGCRVLAKHSTELWAKGVVTKMMDDMRCTIQFESNRKEEEIAVEHLWPLDETDTNGDSDSDYSDVVSREEVINMSLMIKSCDKALGDWEKHTKGVGSRLMEKMGYITGSGLGKMSDGRVEPVSALILPKGKSLDYCMTLRENCGGASDFYSAEKKLRMQQKKIEKRLAREEQRQQEMQNKGVFNFLNETLSTKKNSQKNTTTDIKNESSRDLNVASFKNVESMKRIECDLLKIKESLSRHQDSTSHVHKMLKDKLASKQNELHNLQQQSIKIANEQKRRDDQRKMAVF